MLTIDVSFGMKFTCKTRTQDTLFTITKNVTKDGFITS